MSRWMTGDGSTVNVEVQQDCMRYATYEGGKAAVSDGLSNCC